MDNWPVQLQERLNASSFEVQLGSTTVRSDMDVGPAKVRSRCTDAVDIYTCSVFLDIDDYAILTTFFKTTLGNGTLRFTFDDPFTGESEIFRFASPPQVRAIGGRMFEVSMTWERFP